MADVSTQEKLYKQLPSPDAPREPVVEHCLTKDFTVTDKAGKETVVTRPECKFVFEKENGSKVCCAYLLPAGQWRLGCGLASNKIDPEQAAKKKMVNPIKASKRGRK